MALGEAGKKPEKKTVAITDEQRLKLIEAVKQTPPVQPVTTHYHFNSPSGVYIGNGTGVSGTYQPSITTTAGTNPLDGYTWVGDSFTTSGSFKPVCPHEFIELYTEVDGVHGTCRLCGNQARLDFVPGGVTSLKVREFLEEILAREDIDAMDNASRERLLEKYLFFMERFLDEQRGMASVASMLELARKKLAIDPTDS